MNDQKLVEKFLKDFVSKLTKKIEDKIDFILLFGSAARGEWKKGSSDVDMIIQVKNNKFVRLVREEAEKIFWKLDKEHKTEFNKVCSLKREDIIQQIEAEARLYLPFEVFGPEDLDWSKSEVKKLELVLGAKLFLSQAMIFQKMKQEGKILYGRDIRKEIKIRPTIFEKIKAILIPHHISFFSVLLSPFAPKYALRWASKSLLYSIESALFFLEKPLGRRMSYSISKLRNELVGQVKQKHKFGFIEIDLVFNYDYTKPLHFNLIKEAVKLKYNWDKESRRYKRRDTIKFCARSFAFIVKLNWLIIGYKLFG